MKRLLLSLCAAATLATGLAAASAHADPYDRWDHRREHRWDDDRRDRRDWGDGGAWDRRGDRDWDDRRYNWDDRRYNGYYSNNRWYYGRPPVNSYRDPYYRPGYNAWTRGAVLPGYYRGYIVRDYDRYHLRLPPRGYVWYQVGDDFILASLATGLIFEIIPR